MESDLEKWGVIYIKDPKRAVKWMAGCILLARIVLSLHAYSGNPPSENSKQVMKRIEERGRYMQKNHPNLFEDAVNRYLELSKWERTERKD